MKKVLCVPLWLILLAGVCVTPGWSSGLIVNPGFETSGAVSPAWMDWFYLDPDGDSSNLRYSGGFMGATAHGGAYYLWGGEISPETSVEHSGTTSQLGIVTQPGQMYTLSFWVRNLPGSPAENSLEVYWQATSQTFQSAIGSGGPTTQQMLDEVAAFQTGTQRLRMENIAASDGSGADNGYTQYQVQVTGSGRDNLMFELYNPPTALLLDDVGLTESATPEPSTFVLAGVAGLALLGARGKQDRRARRQS